MAGNKHKKTDKRFLFKILGLILLCVLLIGINHLINYKNVGMSSNELLQKSPNDIVDYLNSRGFSDIKVQINAENSDIIPDGDNNVLSVSIDNVTSFDENTRFPRDAEIIIICQPSPERVTEEYSYSISEILEQTPDEQIRLFIQNSIVPDEEASASEKLSNCICKRISYKMVSTTDTEVKAEITYPDAASAYRECLLNASSDETINEFYKRVTDMVESEKYEYITKVITLQYETDGVALVYNDEIVDALTGGLFAMYLEEAEND